MSRGTTGIGGIFFTCPDGKFGRILDPAGTRLELWEPSDRAFD